MSKLIIERLEHRERYTRPVDLRLLEDGAISPTARLIGVWLLSKPEGWSVTYDSIIQQLGISRSAVNNAVQTLENAGYIGFQREKGGNGRFTECTWTMYENPSLNTRNADNQNMENHSVETDTVEDSHSSESAKAENANVVSISRNKASAQDENNHSTENHIVEMHTDLEIRVLNEEEKNNPAPAKPARGKKSSPKKSPAQSSAQEVSGEVYELMDYLKAAKKAQGVTEIAFDGAWRGKSKTAGKAMLDSGLSMDTVKEAIDWLVDDPFHGPGVVSLFDVKQKLPVYQAKAKAAQSKPQLQATGTYGASQDGGMDEIDRIIAEQSLWMEGAN